MVARSCLRNREHSSSHPSLRSCILVVSSWPLLTCVMVSSHACDSHTCDWQVALLALLFSLLPAPLSLQEQPQPLLFSGAFAVLSPWDVLVDTLFSQLSWTPLHALGSAKAVSRCHCLYRLREISGPFWSCNWRFKSSGIWNESGDLSRATEKAYSAGWPGSYSRLSIKVGRQDQK